MLLEQERRERTISHLVSKVAYTALGVGALITPDVVQALSAPAIVSSATTDINTAQLLKQRDYNYSLLRTTEQVESGEVIPLANGEFHPNDGRTRGFGIEGFSVTEAMNDIYQTEGGKTKWGEPVSRQYKLGEGIYQAFEKGIFQLLPEGKGGGWTVNFVNVFDELGRLGKDNWLESVRQTPISADWSSDQGKNFPEIIDNHFKILDVYPQITAYIQANPNWLNQYGLPVSVKDYGPWISVRMQRAVIQLLKQDFPYGKQRDIIIANGGSVAKEAGGIIPEEALRPEAIDYDLIIERKIIRDLGNGSYEVQETRRREVQYPSYYSQFANAEGVAIRAPASVNPQSLKKTSDIVGQMIRNLRPDVKTRLLSQKPAVIIWPANTLINSLPEMREIISTPSYSLEDLGGMNTQKPYNYNQNISAVGEKYFAIARGAENVVLHEFGHGVMQVFSPDMSQQWSQIFANAVAGGKLYDRFCVQQLETCSREYWAAVSGLYFTNPDKLLNDNPETYSFTHSIYN